MLVNIVTTGLFTVNIGLDGGELLFAGGMDVSELPGEMRQTKVKILVWSSGNIQCP
jgi:hypothetical protein